MEKATDSYAEAMRRRYAEPAECAAHEAAVVEEMQVERVETQRPGLFAYDPDESERLRRVFATWDFRNGT